MKLREEKNREETVLKEKISKKARKRLRESDQARKGAGRMPGHTVLKKDAPNSEMRRQAVRRQRPVGVRMGEPGSQKDCHPERERYPGN